MAKLEVQMMVHGKSIEPGVPRDDSMKKRYLLEHSSKVNMWGASKGFICSGSALKWRIIR
jgi:hypothetical protein